MITVKELNNISEDTIDNNYRFRRFLKTHADEKELDRQFKMLHNKYFKDFDCKSCRNCCRELGISTTEEEIEEFSKYYNFDINKIKEKLNQNYFKYDAQPCPFLKKDNTCTIEKCKPRTCKEYPYTNKEERLESLLTIMNNTLICPVVYEIVEELKRIYNFK